MKTASALLKLLYPDGKIADADLEEALLLAVEFRQRVRDQLNLISPGEYEKVALAIRMEPSGKMLAPVLRDSQREQKVTLPEAAAVGEVIGLAVSGDHGCLLRFEMQATKGNGRIVPLGSIQKVMRESIEAAAQYVKAKYEDLGITAEWRQSYDVAILGTFMGVPKEGPSAGAALVTGIVSVLKGLKVRNDLAMTGEITILGKVLPVGGIQQKLLAAYEAGVKEVLIPAENVSDTAVLPAIVKEKLKITPVTRVEEVLKAALLP
jgi:ATP-dependent Lon protease